MLPCALSRRGMLHRRVGCFSTGAATKLLQLKEVFLDFPQTTEQLVSVLRPYYELELPLKIAFGPEHFAATEKWNLDYLKNTIGHCACDVEIGGSMNGDRVTIDFDQYAQYLDLVRSNCAKDVPREQLLYMAQNDLPNELFNDIEIPKVCTDASYSLGAGKLYNTMIWIGPIGCVSRLHYDPLDNFLMQIIGRKRVFLIDKKIDSNLLYIGDQFRQQRNVSAIEDVETPDIQTFPMFQFVPEILTTELSPGDVLFIPKKWWHSVRSLDYSISVNAWWR
jgi:hypothetical protein